MDGGKRRCDGGVDLLAGTELVEPLRRIGIDDPPRLAGGAERGEAGRWMLGREPVDPRRHHGPDDTAVDRGHGPRRVRDDRLVEVDRVGQRWARAGRRACDSVGSVGDEVVEADVAHVCGAEGGDHRAVDQLVVRVPRRREDQRKQVVGRVTRHLEVDPLQVLALADIGLQVDPVVACGIGVGRELGPVGNHEVVAAVGPRLRAYARELRDPHRRACDGGLIVERVDRPAHVDRRQDRLLLRLGAGGGQTDQHGERESKDVEQSHAGSPAVDRASTIGRGLKRLQIVASRSEH